MADDNLYEGNFIAFQNVKKRDTHPDYRGEIVVNELRDVILIWVDQDKNGNDFLSGTFFNGNFTAYVNVKKNTTHPDYRGEVIVDGVRKEIVIWIKEDKNGDQFLSGSINPLKVGNLKPRES